MNKTVKKYLISSLITFITAFAIAILPHIDGLTLDTITNGSLVGLLFAGVRAGIKAILEAIANKS